MAPGRFGDSWDTSRMTEFVPLNPAPTAIMLSREGGVDGYEIFLSGRFQFFRNFLNSLPGAFNMAKFSMCLSHTNAQRKLILHAGMGKEKIAALIEPVHKLLIDIIAAAVTRLVWTLTIPERITFI